MTDDFDDFSGYTSVKSIAKIAAKAAEELRSQGLQLHPVTLKGRGPKGLVTSAWGRAWCLNLEKYADSLPLLPRGRSLLRNGSVLDLIINTGVIDAKVCADRVYQVTIKSHVCPDETWQSIKQFAAGSIASVTEFLQGKIPDALMTTLTKPEGGILPTPETIRFSCDCPQWADFCEHSAAALYGVGVRLDERPELLFTLAGVDPDEIIVSSIGSTTTAVSPDQTLEQDDLGNLFGIDLE